MKKILFLTSVLLISASAQAAPQVATSFVTANIGLCKALASLADSCQTSQENLQKLEGKLAALQPGSADYQKWAAQLPILEKTKNLVCSLIEDDETRTEMATAQIRLDQPYTLKTASLDRGAMGHVEFTGEISGDSVQLDPPAVRMTVFGPLFCQAVEKANGDTVKALEAIAEEFTTQP